MNKIVYTFFIEILFVVSLVAQIAPEIQWERSIGGSENESVQHIISTEDGGFLLVGSTSSSDYNVSREEGEGNLWLVKLNSLGLIEWEKNYDHSAKKVIKTEDKGYLILGNADLGDSLKTDFWLLKVDSLGKYEWEKSLGGQGEDIASDIIQLSDGGFALIGRTQSLEFENFHLPITLYDMGVIRLDSSGNVLWQKAFGGNKTEYGTSILQRPPNLGEIHGDLFLYGRTSSKDTGDIDFTPGLVDFWMLIIDDTTGMKADLELDHIDVGCQEFATDIMYLNNDYIGCGYTSFFNNSWCQAYADTYPGDKDAVIFRSSESSVIWGRVVGGLDEDKVECVIETQDEKIVLAGYSDSEDELFWKSSSNISEVGTKTQIGNFDYWLIQMSSNGNYEWSIKLGGTDYDKAYGIINVDNGEYLVAGVSESSDNDVSQNLGAQDIWLVKLGDESCSTGERPEQPLVTGKTVYCNEDSITMSAPFYQGADVHYYWETPFGVIETDQPRLVLNNISTEQHEGSYALLVTVDGCASPVSPLLDIEVINEIATTAPDFFTCENEVKLSTDLPQSDLVTSKWATNGFAEILNETDSFSLVRNLQPGINELYWIFSTPECPDFESDTIIIFYEQPIATDDISNLDIRSSSIEIDVLANDQLAGLQEVELNIIQDPIVGETTVTTGNQTIAYEGLSFNGLLVQFTYEVCSVGCPELCDVATVSISRSEFPVPEGITPNNDGKNDFLMIDGLMTAYPNHHFYLYNRWGEEVFQASPYQNDWEGTRDGEPLPEGVYYYFIELGEGIKPLQGSIHLFRD